MSVYNDFIPPDHSVQQQKPPDNQRAAEPAPASDQHIPSLVQSGHSGSAQVPNQGTASKADRIMSMLLDGEHSEPLFGPISASDGNIPGPKFTLGITAQPGSTPASIKNAQAPDNAISIHIEAEPEPKPNAAGAGANPEVPPKSAEQQGAQPGVQIVVDNLFASPIQDQPIGAQPGQPPQQQPLLHSAPQEAGDVQPLQPLPAEAAIAKAAAGEAQLPLPPPQQQPSVPLPGAQQQDQVNSQLPGQPQQIGSDAAALQLPPHQPGGQPQPLQQQPLQQQPLQQQPLQQQPLQQQPLPGHGLNQQQALQPLQQVPAAPPPPAPGIPLPAAVRAPGVPQAQPLNPRLPGARVQQAQAQLQANAAANAAAAAAAAPTGPVLVAQADLDACDAIVQDNTISLDAQLVKVFKKISKVGNTAVDPKKCKFSHRIKSENPLERMISKGQVFYKTEAEITVSGTDKNGNPFTKLLTVPVFLRVGDMQKAMEAAEKYLEASLEIARATYDTTFNPTSIEGFPSDVKKREDYAGQKCMVIGLKKTGGEIRLLGSEGRISEALTFRIAPKVVNPKAAHDLTKSITSHTQDVEAPVRFQDSFNVNDNNPASIKALLDKQKEERNAIQKQLIAQKEVFKEKISQRSSWGMGLVDKLFSRPAAGNTERDVGELQQFQRQNRADLLSYNSITLAELRNFARPITPNALNEINRLGLEIQNKYGEAIPGLDGTVQDLDRIINYLDAKSTQLAPLADTNLANEITRLRNAVKTTKQKETAAQAKLANDNRAVITQLQTVNGSIVPANAPPTDQELTRINGLMVTIGLPANYFTAPVTNQQIKNTITKLVILEQVHALEKMADRAELSQPRLREVNDLLAQLQPPLPPLAVGATVGDALRTFAAIKAEEAELNPNSLAGAKLKAAEARTELNNLHAGIQENRNNFYTASQEMGNNLAKLEDQERFLTGIGVAMRNSPRRAEFDQSGVITKLNQQLTELGALKREYRALKSTLDSQLNILPAPQNIPVANAAANIVQPVIAQAVAAQAVPAPGPGGQP